MFNSSDLKIRWQHQDVTDKWNNSTRLNGTHTPVWQSKLPKNIWKSKWIDIFLKKYFKQKESLPQQKTAHAPTEAQIQKHAGFQYNCHICALQHLMLLRWGYNKQVDKRHRCNNWHLLILITPSPWHSTGVKWCKVVPQKPFTKLISTDDDLRNIKWFKRKTLNLTKTQASPNSSLRHRLFKLFSSTCQTRTK